MIVFGGHDLLALVSQQLLIPNNGFQKPLQRARCHVLIQSNRFGILTLHVRQQPLHVDQQQGSPSRSSKTTGKSL